jgi:hypothetical protein
VVLFICTYFVLDSEQERVDSEQERLESEQERLDS